MTSPSQAVTAETLPVIVYQDVRVITTELLASLYGAEPKNLQMNFGRNEARFVDGKHYFKLEGEALKEFKGLNCTTDSGSVEISKHARNLTLWTERGAARHAKMLDTDQAWEVFERLEDAYFAKPSPSGPVQMGEGIRAIVLAARPDWAALVRYHEMGLTPAEIGKLIDCSAPTVRSRLRQLEQAGILVYEAKKGRPLGIPRVSMADNGPTLRAPASPKSPRRPGEPARPMTQAEHDQILELHRLGLSQTDIAKRLGRARSSIGRSLERATLERTAKGGPANG